MTESARPRRRAWPWVVPVLALLVVAALGLVVAAFLVRSETTDERTFASGEVDRITVTVLAGNVEVAAEDRPDVRVEAQLRSGLWSEPVSTIEAEAGVLTVEGRCRTVILNLCSVSYRVSVPSGEAVAVDIVTTAGNIDLTALSGVVSGGSTAGNITVIDHQGVEARLRTTAGNVSFEASEPPNLLSIETTAGSVTVRVPDVGYRIDATTIVGNTDIGLSETTDSERTISAVTTAGNIDLRPR